MADYKLRLDVDAKLLEQALEKAVKKAFGKIPSMSGGGIGGGFGGMGGSSAESQKFKFKEKKWKQSKKLTIEEHKLRNKNLYDMKSAYIREKAALRAHNIMLEKSGAQAQRTFRMIGQLVGGRMGGTAGQVVDMGLQGLSRARSGRTQTRATKLAYGKMAKKDKRVYDAEHGGPPEASGTFNKVMDKFDTVKQGPIGQFMKKNKDAFNKRAPKTGKALGVAGKAAGVMGKGGTQLVKLAGIGAALAGGAGLGKMIVDSSPMLKAMLKLLNVGIMLILRPIGDFIGFMLRPLLLKFVTKVAIPAYKQGAGLAKEWGTKMSKVLLLMFTNPESFLKLAILDPLMGSWAKSKEGLMRQLSVIGAYLNPMYYLDADGRDKELADIKASQFDENNPNSDININKRFPGLWNDPNTGLAGGMLGGMADTDTGKRLEELQQMTTEELNTGNAKTNIIIDNTKAAGDAVSDLEDKVIIGNESQQQTADNTAELVRLAQEAALAEIARTNANNAKMDEIMDEQIEFFEENPYKRNTIIGTQAIEDDFNDKEKDARDERNMKKYGQLANPDGSIEVNISSLSPEAQRILASANNYRIGAIGSGTCPIVGSRKGFYNSPIATSDMGQCYTSERYRTGEETNPNNYKYLQEDSEYMSLGVETRSGAEMYTEAIKEAAKSGNEVWEEYKIMEAAAAAAALLSRSELEAAKAMEIEAQQQYKAAVVVTDLEEAGLRESDKQLELQEQVTDIDGEIFKEKEEQKINTIKSTSFTGDIMNLLRQAHDYVKSLMRSMGFKIPNAPVINPTPTQPTPTTPEEPTNHSGLTNYRVLFEDGDPLEKLLTAREKMVFQSHSNYGTVHPSYADRGIVKSIKKMARGGIIGEKIFGIGESGQQYMFGESGPETVTPGVGGTVNNGGGSTFNITINASNVGDIERQLKPAILKMLKESTARAGIV